MVSELNIKAKEYLKYFCVDITDRSPGTPGNKKATSFFEKTISSFGFETEKQEFDCFDWEENGAKLSIDGKFFEVFVSPYSLGCKVEAPFYVISDIDQLEDSNIKDKVVLLIGNIAKEQLMPKNFPFYNPEEHKKIIKLLEDKAPGAIISVAAPNPGSVGGAYPYPLIEDGDFDIPSVFICKEEGEKLIPFAGKEAFLEINAKRIPSDGYNVIAQRGVGKIGKIALCAHIDSRKGTPGAIDNAAGVIVLLLLAEFLKDYENATQIEIVATNGEDYYSNAGQIEYFIKNRADLQNIFLGINIDGAGYFKGNTSVSFYNCSAEIEEAVCKIILKRKDIKEGNSWYQGEHMAFVQNQIPSIAITSENVVELMNIEHTSKDTPDIIDTNKLVDLADSLYEFLLDLGKNK